MSALGWTEEQVAYLRERWESDGATVIGRDLGKSRVAVSVKAGRLGLPRRIPKPVKKVAQPKKTHGGHKSGASIVAASEARGSRYESGWVEKEEAKEAARLPAFADRSGSVALLDLRDHHCRWPFDAADGSTRFCGCSKADPTTSYCAEHLTMSAGQGTRSERDAA